MFHGSGAVAFSTKGEYGVRLMVQLGRHFGQGPASLAEIAAEEELPRAYLEQLVMSLRDAGLVTSTRGAHGGYELARPPAEIRMSDVLRALEGPLAPMICASDDPEHAIVCDRSLALHRQRPLGPRPRRDHLDPRFHDPRRPRATARRRRRRPQGSAHHIVTDSTASNDILVIRGLRVAPVANPETEILQGIDLEVGKGEVHAIMGPNGSGKTTLAYALLGHPAYVVTGGEVHWKGRDILKLSPTSGPASGCSSRSSTPPRSPA